MAVGGVQGMKQAWVRAESFRGVTAGLAHAALLVQTPAGMRDGDQRRRAELGGGRVRKTLSCGYWSGQYYTGLGVYSVRSARSAGSCRCGARRSVGIRSSWWRNGDGPIPNANRGRVRGAFRTKKTCLPWPTQGELRCADRDLFVVPPMDFDAATTSAERYVQVKPHVNRAGREGRGCRCTTTIRQRWAGSVFNGVGLRE